MPKLEFWSERAGNGATIRLDSGEVVIVSIAQVGVLVRKWEKDAGFLRMLMSNFWGAKLYTESSVYKNAKTAQALSELFPNKAPQLPTFKNPVLAVFANAVWHCGSAAEVCAVLNEVASKATQHEAMPSKARAPAKVGKPLLTVEEVMSRYYRLHESYPSAILDVTMLPVPKAQMKALLKSLYVKAKTAELQNHIAVGFALLGFFQEGVGPNPIDLRLFPNSGKPTRADTERDATTLWLNFASAEQEILSAEWKRFLAGEPI